MYLLLCVVIVFFDLVIFFELKKLYWLKGEVDIVVIVEFGMVCIVCEGIDVIFFVYGVFVFFVLEVVEVVVVEGCSV